MPCKMGFLKMMQTSQENTCVGAYFIKKLQPADQQQVTKYAEFLTDCYYILYKNWTN